MTQLNKYFWVGDGSPSITKDIPIGAKYLNLTGGDWWTLQTSGWVNTPEGDVPPFDTGDISADGAISYTNGSFQKCVTDGVEPIELTGGSEGSKLELWVTDSGSGCTVTVTATVPDASSATGWELGAGKTGVFLFRYLNGAWRWLSVTGNF